MPTYLAVFSLSLFLIACGGAKNPYYHDVLIEDIEQQCPINDPGSDDSCTYILHLENGAIIHTSTKEDINYKWFSNSMIL